VPAVLRKIQYWLGHLHDSAMINLIMMTCTNVCLHPKSGQSRNRTIDEVYSDVGSGEFIDIRVPQLAHKKRKVRSIYPLPGAGRSAPGSGDGWRDSRFPKATYS
jgi:hypothetical protein